MYDPQYPQYGQYQQLPPPYPHRPYRPGLVARMSAPVRTLIGIGAFLPLVGLGAYFVFYFFFIFSFIGRASAAASRNPAQPVPFPTEFFAGFAVAGLLLFVTILAYYALLVLFVIDLHKNDRITEDAKIIWTFALFFGSVIALPIYWFLYFRSVPPMPPMALQPQYVSQPMPPGMATQPPAPQQTQQPIPQPVEPENPPR